MTPAFELLDQTGLPHHFRRRIRAEGYVQREYGVIVDLPPGAEVVVQVAPSTPAYLVAVSAYEKDPLSGFELTISSEQWRFSSAPIRSNLLKPGSAQGIALQQRLLADAQIIPLGALQIRIRSYGVATQECALMLVFAEASSAGWVPPEVEHEAQETLSVRLDAVGTGAARRSSSSPFAVSAFDAGAGGSGASMQLSYRPVEIGINNDTAVILEGALASIEIWGLLLYLNGQHTEAVKVVLYARDARGDLRLIQPSEGVQPGASINLPKTDAPYFTLNPGESLVMQTTQALADVALFGGHVRYRVV